MKRIFSCLILILFSSLSFSLTRTWNGATTGSVAWAGAWTAADPVGGDAATINITNGDALVITGVPTISLTTFTITISSGSGTVTLQGATTTITLTSTLTVNSGVTLITDGTGNIVNLSVGAAPSISGVFTVSSGSTITSTTATAWTITGTVNVNGTYEHNVNAGSIPICTWGTGSLCKITGMTTGFDSNDNAFESYTCTVQSFYDFEWDCTSQTATIGLNPNNGTMTVSNNFTVTSTNSGELSVGCGSTSKKGGPNTLSIGGNCTVNAGVFAIDNVSSAVANTLTVTGTLSVNGTAKLYGRGTTNPATGGSFVLNSGNFSIATGATFDASAANLGTGGTINFNGNVTVTGSGVYKSTNKFVTTNFAGGGATQVWNNNGAGYAKANFDLWTVQSGSVLQLASNLLTSASSSHNDYFTVNGTLIFGTGSTEGVDDFYVDVSEGASDMDGTDAFIVSAGATLKLTSTAGIYSNSNGNNESGNIRQYYLSRYSSTYLSQAANYQFIGDAAQATGAGFPATANNLTINNSGDAAVTLTNNCTVNGTMFMTRGTLTLSGTLSYHATTSTLTYNSTTAAQTTAASEFPAASGPYNLTINNASGVTLLGSANRTINGTVTMTSGTLDLNGNTLTLDATAGNISGETNAARIFGSGEISKQMTCSANSTAYAFGSIGVTITTQGSGNVPGVTTVLRGHGAQTGQASKTSIERYYTITPTTNTSLGATLKMEFFADELNGQTANSDMKLYRAEDPYGVNDWGVVTSTWYDAATDYVEATGVAAFSRWTISNSASSPLPVSLLNFEVVPVSDKIEVNWTTSSEENNDFFTVERSKDGTIFNEIARIPGAGNSNNLLSYKAIDNEPLIGHSYYRLKQTDFNGKFSFPGMDAVYFEGILNVKNLFVVPNPVNNTDFNLVFDAQQEEEIEVRLYNHIGKLLLSKNVMSKIGSNAFNLDLPNKSSGLYYLEIISNGIEVKTKVVKL